VGVVAGLYRSRNFSRSREGRRLDPRSFWQPRRLHQRRRRHNTLTSAHALARPHLPTPYLQQSRASTPPGRRSQRPATLTAWSINMPSATGQSWEKYQKNFADDEVEEKKITPLTDE
jgi:hypothetical protein